MSTKNLFSLLLAVVFILTSAVPANAYWVWSPEQGKFVNPEGGAAQDAAEEQYNYAMRFYREKNYDEAVKQLEELLKKDPGASIASEAQYRLGSIYEERADYLKAFDAYKKLVKSYPQSDRFTEVIEREFRIGNLFLSGQKGKLMGLKVLPSLKLAAEVFEHIVETAPYSEYGDQALFHLGLTYKQMGNFSKAKESFQELIDQYPQSEYVAKSRFQVAESAYEQSAFQYRDQRALDDAARNVDRFLERYPDAEATERASKLRQIIDEKNAEKSYRVGRYYEKQNQLKSALIYFEDVAVRYPHTKWGQKSQERLNMLEQPAEYLSEREQQLAEKKKNLEAQLKQLEKKDSTKRPEIEKQWAMVDQNIKKLDEEKQNSLDRRREDIERREKELNRRFKNLDKKRKQSEANDSEDFQRAMQRWYDALVTERDELEQEKRRLDSWHETLGVDQKKDLWDAIPFMGEGVSELEKVKQLEAKKLYHLAEDKKQLFKEKERLYKQLDELSALLRSSDLEKMSIDRESTVWLETIEADEERVAIEQQRLKQIRENIKQIEAELDKKKISYESRFGLSPLKSIIAVPTNLVVASGEAVVQSIDKSVSFLNPFDGGEEGELQLLLEKRMHTQEKIATQQSITETLAQAFDAELALQEQKRLLDELDVESEGDPRAMRKEIKTIEKEIRSAYQEIEDRGKAKKELTDQLHEIIKTEMKANNPLSSVAAPAVATGKAVKAFFVGYPDEAAELTQTVNRMSSKANPKAVDLKEDIELQSFMIEAKSREILNLERELEILKAKASLQGGYKFRSAFVNVPYQFIGGAINSARKVLPTKNREEILIQRLNEETAELEKLKQELGEFDNRIARLEGRSSAVKAAPQVSAQSGEDTDSALSQAEQELMKADINSLMVKLETEERAYQKTKESLSEKVDLSKSTVKTQKSQAGLDEAHEKRLAEEQEKLRKDLREIHEELLEKIERESRLENEEAQILEKKISHIDKVVQTVQSKAMSQDLLNERARLEDRVAKLELRRDFLSKEMQRFQINKN